MEEFIARHCAEFTFPDRYSYIVYLGRKDDCLHLLSDEELQLLFFFLDRIVRNEKLSDRRGDKGYKEIKPIAGSFAITVKNSLKMQYCPMTAARLSGCELFDRNPSSYKGCGTSRVRRNEIIDIQIISYMTYTEALNWKNEHLKLLGTMDDKGFVVSALVVVPSNPSERDIFFRRYLFTEDKETAILPYISGDVQVWSIDLGRLESHNILFYNILAQ